MGDLRIIAGEHGSRRIKVPASVARPTTDRVREALFSSLESLRGGMAGARVLDAFAGSGALALEAMSRGAASACLVERDKRAAEVVRSNVKALGCAAQTDILCCDALASAARIAARGPFDMVFLDPPYATGPEEAAALLAALREAAALAPGAIISYEHAAEKADAVARALADAGFTMLKQKRYGKAHLTFARLQG